MVSYNISTGKDYHTQRNNEIDPINACATTAMVMALKYSGVKLPDCRGRQEEDALLEFIRGNKEVQEAYKKSLPWEFEKGIPANELPTMRELGTNLWVGREVNKFVWGATMREILYSLVLQKAVVVSGSWPYMNHNGEVTTIPHVVCVVGFESWQHDILCSEGSGDIDLDQVVNIIIDDPFGDYRTLYKDQKGNDVLVPLKDFVKITKEHGSVSRKWAHFIL